MKVSDHVYLVPGVMANCYLLVEPGGLTIIDTGMRHSEKRIIEYIDRLGRSIREVERILITHADLDHYGCLAALQKASGSCTYAGRLEAAAMALGKSSRPVDHSVEYSWQRIPMALFSRLMKPTPIQVDEILVEGQVLPVLGGLQVVETPGHSQGHLSFLVPGAGLLFCGDSMRSGENGLRSSRSRNDWDHALAAASARKQAGLGARIVCPGHGPVVKDAEGKFPV